MGGTILGWRTRCAVEIDAYCRSILLARQRDGILPKFPIWDNIETFNGRPWKGHIDLITGGFPCQDISSAGTGRGIDGPKSSLWKEMARVISEVQPERVFVENSPLLISRGLTTVLSDLAQCGYDARWCVLGACDVGAPHKRARIWIYGHSNKNRKSALSIDDEAQRVQEDAYTLGYRLQRGCKGWTEEGAVGRSRNGSDPGWWEIEPSLDRVVNGVARSRVDRIKALGNGQVPTVAAAAYLILSGGF